MMEKWQGKCIDFIVENNFEHKLYRKIYNEVVSQYGNGNKYLGKKRYESFLQRIYQITYYRMKEMAKPEKFGVVFGG